MATAKTTRAYVIGHSFIGPNNVIFASMMCIMEYGYMNYLNLFILFFLCLHQVDAVLLFLALIWE